MVEVLARQFNTLDFQVMHRTTRSYTGRREVEIVNGPQHRAGMDDWRQALQALTSEELAKCLGISERHSGRIKQGSITVPAALRHLDRLKSMTNIAFVS